MEQIMNQTDVKVSFYLKKSEADAKGNCPVMARLIVGKYSETAFSVKLRVPQSLWLSGRACGKSAAARDINNRLDEIRAAAFSIYAEQSANREVVTAEEVKHQLLGMASEQETLLSYFRLFMRNFEKRVGINRTESSLNGYRNSYDHLVRFLHHLFGGNAIPGFRGFLAVRLHRQGFREKYRSLGRG
jgi:integrase/recombinase XerD